MSSLMTESVINHDGGTVSAYAGSASADAGHHSEFETGEVRPAGLESRRRAENGASMVASF
jgi:hypothetical protein